MMPYTKTITAAKFSGKSALLHCNFCSDGAEFVKSNGFQQCCQPCWDAGRHVEGSLQACGCCCRYCGPGLNLGAVVEVNMDTNDPITCSYCGNNAHTCERKP